LRHEQQAAAHVLDREIHFPGAVREHAVAEQALEQALGGRFIVSGLGAHERQDSAIDRAQRLAPSLTSARETRCSSAIIRRD